MIIVYILLGVVALFFLLQFAMVFKMRQQKGKEAPELSGQAGKAIRHGKKAVFYFYSDRCGACKPMTPVVDRLRKRSRNVFMVDIARDMDTARKFGVMGTPSLVVVEKGVIKEFVVGPQPEDRLRQLAA